MTLPTENKKIKIRNDSAADWTSADPTLLIGELGYETDTGKMKIGDGVTAWTSLAYFYDPTTAVTVAYAEIHVHDGNSAQSIPAGSSYEKITAFVDNGLNSNCTADAANDKITPTLAGVYRAEGSVSFTCGTNNVVWECSVFVDGVEQNQIHFSRKVGTGTDVGNAGFTGFLDVDPANVDVDVRMKHDNVGAVNLTVIQANLNVQYIGPS